MNKPTQEQINKELNRDSLVETEQILGKRIDKFNDKEQAFAMMKFVQDNKLKESVLKRANDTYFSMPWKDFIDLIESLGFELQQSWTYKAFGEPSTAVVYMKGGMLLIATSTDHEERINGGHLYAEAELKEGINLGQINSFQTGGYFDFERNRVDSSYDIRQGLVNHINELESKTTILPVFESTSTNLWFATFEDEKRIGSNFREYDKLRTERIMSSTDKVKTLCSPFIDEPVIIKSGTYSSLGLNFVNLTGNISAIESGAFKDCPNLTEIYIKSDVQIPIDMIENCPNLKKLVVHGAPVPIVDGKIKDTSLTGIIESFKQQTDDENKLINNILQKKEKLEQMIENCKTKNKINMVQALLSTKKEILDNTQEFSLNIGYDVRIYNFGYGLSVFVDEDKRDSYDGKRTLALIDKLIERVNSEEITSLDARFGHKRERLELEDEQVKLLKQSVEKIDEKLKELGIDINIKQNER